MTQQTKIDRTGEVWGEWTVLYEDTARPRAWVCRCSCGTERSVLGQNLRRGFTKSCGCAKPEIPKGAEHPFFGKTSTETLRWMGEAIEYAAAHKRLIRGLGTASEFSCIECASEARNWSYQHGCPNERISESTKDNGKPFCPMGPTEHPDCYRPMCAACHRAFDRELVRL